MKKEKKKNVCGCDNSYEELTIKEESKYKKIEYTIKTWRIDHRCSVHQLNSRKRADKFYHRVNKKTGRGYTKSPKPLKQR